MQARLSYDSKKNSLNIELLKNYYAKNYMNIGNDDKRFRELKKVCQISDNESFEKIDTLVWVEFTYLDEQSSSVHVNPIKWPRSNRDPYDDIPKNILSVKLFHHIKSKYKHHEIPADIQVSEDCLLQKLNDRYVEDLVSRKLFIQTRNNKKTVFFQTGIRLKNGAMLSLSFTSDDKYEWVFDDLHNSPYVVSNMLTNFSHFDNFDEFIRRLSKKALSGEQWGVSPEDPYEI